MNTNTKRHQDVGPVSDVHGKTVQVQMRKNKPRPEPRRQLDIIDVQLQAQLKQGGREVPATTKQFRKLAHTKLWSCVYAEARVKQA